MWHTPLAPWHHAQGQNLVAHTPGPLASRTGSKPCGTHPWPGITHQSGTHPWPGITHRVPGAGKLEISFTPAGGSAPIKHVVHDFGPDGGALAYALVDRPNVRLERGTQPPAPLLARNHKDGGAALAAKHSACTGPQQRSPCLPPSFPPSPTGVAMAMFNTEDRWERAASCLACAPSRVQGFLQLRPPLAGCTSEKKPGWLPRVGIPRPWLASCSPCLHPSTIFRPKPPAPPPPSSDHNPPAPPAPTPHG